MKATFKQFIEKYGKEFFNFEKFDAGSNFSGIYHPIEGFKIYINAAKVSYIGEFESGNVVIYSSHRDPQRILAKDDSILLINVEKVEEIPLSI